MWLYVCLCVYKDVKFQQTNFYGEIPLHTVWSIVVAGIRMDLCLKTISFFLFIGRNAIYDKSRKIFLMEPSRALFVCLREISEKSFKRFSKYSLYRNIEPLVLCRYMR